MLLLREMAKEHPVRAAPHNRRGRWEFGASTTFGGVGGFGSSSHPTAFPSGAGKPTQPASAPLTTAEMNIVRNIADFIRSGRTLS